MTALPFRTGTGAPRPVAYTHGQTRLAQLQQAHAQAMAAELSADPLSLERRRHATRADRLARQIRELTA